jgi:hypothetical protein
MENVREVGARHGDYSRKQPDDPADFIRRAVRIAEKAGIEAIADGLVEIVEVYGARGQGIIARFAPETGKITSMKSTSTGAIRQSMSGSVITAARVGSPPEAATI